MRVGVPAWVRTCYYMNASRKGLSLEPSSVCADIIILLRSAHRQSHSSTVDVVSRLRTAKPRNRGSNSTKEKRRICSEHRQVLDPPRALLLWLMRLERETDDSHVSRVEVLDEWSCTSTPGMPSWCALNLLHSWTDIRECDSCIQHMARHLILQ